MDKKAKVKLIGSLTIIVLAIITALVLYNNSVKEDFSNISHAETYRVGDEFSGVYHRPACPNGKNVPSPVIFDHYDTPELNNAEARKAGYKPCSRCLPDQD